MGRIYLAEDELTGERVALKVAVDDTHGPDPRFVRESALLAELSHPALVRHVAHGEAGDGRRFLAMEWLEGCDLAERLRPTWDGPREVRTRLPVADALRVAARVAHALAAMHRRGLVHRDLKPSNVFLPDGDPARAKLLDLGLARREHDRGVTLSGVVVGTPAYMSPEQARSAEGVDARTDVWALGCVLFECLAGVAAFRGDHPVAIFAKILIDDPPRLADHVVVPAEVDDLVARMLSRDRDARPADASLLAARLEELAAEGSMVGPRSIATAPLSAALGSAERRVVSVVVARTRHDSAIDVSSSRESESLAADALSGFGGRVEPLADGSLLFVLDGSRTPLDQAQRACRAALRLRAVLPSTPLVVVTGLAETGRGVLGSLLDLAGRLLATAGPREIRLDGTTHGLVEAKLDTSEADGAFLLLGRRDTGERPRTLLGKRTAWVGRDREMATLLGLHAECVEESVARVVLVTAPPGAGKSRLRQELVERLAERDDGGEILFAQADALSSGSPFVVVAQLVRRAAGILEAEPDVDQRAKLRAHVEGRLADRGESTLAFLTELVGLRGEPVPDEVRAARRDPLLLGDRMRAAFEGWLSAACHRGPVVIVLEDLHWGDLPSVKFLDAALRALADAPLLVIALARPEVHDAFPGLFAARSPTEMRLPAIPKKAAARLVRQVLGGEATDAIVDLVVERSEGNAFYLEELIRAVGQGSTDALALPDTVLGMLQARLDALGADAKRVLRAASVFGEVFWLGGVVELLGAASREEVEERLNALAGDEIVARRSVSRIPDETELGFRHALVRDAAYAMLTDEDRALGHRLAASWLEKMHEGDALALAEHHVRGEQPALAVTWFRRAAEQALLGNDLSAAVAHADRAVAFGAEGELRGALRLVAATASYWSSDYVRARGAAEEARALLRPGTSGWYRALGEQAVSAARSGDPDAVLPIVLDALAPDPDDDAKGAKVIAVARGTFQLVFAGRHAEADDLLARLGALEPDLDPEPLARAQLHHLRGVRAAHAGDVFLFRVHLERAIAAFREAGDLRNVMLETPTLGWCQAELGDFAAAERTLRDALQECARHGVTQTITYAEVNLGYALAGAGRSDEARATQTAAAEACAAQKNPRLEGWSRTHLAVLELSSGRDAAAAEQAARAKDLLAGAPGLRAWAEATLARALARLDRVDEARALAAKAMETLDGMGAVLQSEASIPLALAEVLHRSGDPDGAAHVLDRAKRRLLDRASRIADDQARMAFLSLPDHAATLARAG